VALAVSTSVLGGGRQRLGVLVGEGVLQLQRCVVDIDLFEGATWWLVPARSRRANAVVRALVRDAGARVVLTDAARHDRVMAFLSHAPQVVAWALLDAARADPVARRQLRHAGPGFRGMTRLARSPRALWHDILGANRVEVTRALAALRRALERRRP